VIRRKQPRPDSLRCAGHPVRHSRKDRMSTTPYVPTNCLQRSSGQASVVLTFAQTLCQTGRKFTTQIFSLQFARVRGTIVRE
jgi:hypothetical protein